MWIYEYILELFSFIEYQILSECYFYSHSENENFMFAFVFVLERKEHIGLRHMFCEWIKCFCPCPCTVWAFFSHVDTTQSFYEKAPTAKFFHSGFLFFALPSVFTLFLFEVRSSSIILLLSIFLPLLFRIPNQEYEMEIARRHKKKYIYNDSQVKCVNISREKTVQSEEKRFVITIKLKFWKQKMQKCTQCQWLWMILGAEARNLNASRVFDTLSNTHSHTNHRQKTEHCPNLTLKCCGYKMYGMFYILHFIFHPIKQKLKCVKESNDVCFATNRFQM